jgi:HK97 family phage prohead protease
MTVFTRSYPLSDIAIRSDGTGRTVEAYAAVFNAPTDIADQQGRYREQIHPGAFERTISQRGTRFGVFYNHGMTLQGTPSEMASVPLGSPIEAPRSDGNGLVTVSRYNATPLAGQVLEAIRNGDITGQSFSGRWVHSEPGPDRSSRKYKPMRDGTLPLVTRMEIAMTEYGPTPIPAYEAPMVLGVRARGVTDQHTVRALARAHAHFTRATLAPDETQTLSTLLAMLAGADASIDPIVDALCAADCALDAAQMIVASMLAVPDPDVEDDDATATDATPLDPPSDTSGVGGLTTSSSGRRPSPVSRTSTATLAPAAEDPHAVRVHSGRLTVAQRIRAGMLARGI